MRAVSDYGGGPAGPGGRDEHLPGPRGKRAAPAQTLRPRKDPLMTSDASRRAQEELDQATYDGLAYYDRWLVAFRRNLVERGHLTEAEIERRIAEIRARR